MRLPFVTLFLLSTAAMPAFSQEIPDATNLQSKVGASIRSFWKLEEFRVIAAMKEGDPVSPIALIRFEADVSPSTDLFTSTGESIGPFEVVIPTFDDAESRTLYGTMQLQYKAGEWVGWPIIENPLDNLGQPRDMFSSPTIVLGSEEQTALLATIHDSAIEKARAELEQDLQSLKVQYDANVAAAERGYQARLDDLKANFSPKIAEEQTRLDAELTRLRESHAEKLLALKADLRKQTEAEIAELEAELEAHKQQRAFDIRQAHADLEKQTQLADTLAAVAAKEAEVEDLRKQSRARQLALFESFGKSLPLNFSCSSTEEHRKKDLTLVFSVESVHKSGLYGYSSFYSSDGTEGERYGTSLILTDGSSPTNMRFNLTVNFDRTLGSYDLSFATDGSMTGSATGVMQFYNGSYWVNLNATCNVAVATAG